MARVRWAVMGAGGIARRRTIPEGIVPAKDAELVAVYSPRTGREVADQFGVIAAKSEAELYEMDWNALYVASPVDQHCRQVTQAAKAGRHVLCEKPLALNVQEAEQMVAACQLAKVKLGVAFMMRMHSQHRQAAQIVEQELLGQISYARVQLSCWYPPLDDVWRQDPHRSGGGVIPDLASHCFDLLEMILGKSITQVACMKGNLVHNYAVEDSAVILLRFEGGTMATVDCLYSIPDRASLNRLEVYGSKGSLLAEGTIGQEPTGELKLFSEDQIGGYDAVQSRFQGSHQLLMNDSSESIYLKQIQSFNCAVLDNSPPPTSGEQGLHMQRVIESCYRAARENCVVAVA